MNLLSIRVAALTGIAGAALVGAVLFAGDASASAFSVPLNAAPGAASYGAGSASVDTSGPSPVVRVDLNGARPGMTYRVSACAATGGLACSSDPNGDLLTADPLGGIHGAVVTPAPVRLDVVTVTDVVDANDSYQAWFNGAQTVYSAPAPVTVQPQFATRYTPVLATTPTFGMPITVVPTFVGYYPPTACPAGYVGGLTVVAAPYAPYFGYYNSWYNYLRAYYPFGSVPFTYNTVVVSCR